LIAAGVASSNMLAVPSSARSARRRRPRGVEILNREVTHQRQE